jgi:hypothetical protein
MSCVVALLCTSLSAGMTDAYVAHLSVPYRFTSHWARRSISFCKVALSRRPHSQMSPYYFSRLFKQSTGLSPRQYLLWQWMERAKYLLSDSRRKIVEVSDALGFPHQSHFTTTFHTLVGMTPGEYRRQHSGR